jgi:hypothetical protein
MKLKSILTAVGAGVLATTFAAPAHAELILNTTITANGTGLGALPTLVTIQETGPVNGTESGCVSFGPSTTCAPGTGLVGGDNIAINQLRTAADLPGITNAGQLALVVNLNEPGVDETATLTGLYLSIYSPTGTLLGLHQYTGADLPLLENPGIGSAGTVFTLSAAEQTAAITECPTITQCVFGGGLEFLAGTAQGGPETMFLSFVSPDGVIPPGQQPVSEPAPIALFAVALLALAAMRRKVA